MGDLGRNEGKHFYTIIAMNSNCIVIFPHFAFTKADYFVFRVKLNLLQR